MATKSKTVQAAEEGERAAGGPIKAYAKGGRVTGFKGYGKSKKV